MRHREVVVASVESTAEGMAYGAIMFSIVLYVDLSHVKCRRSVA